MDNRATVGILDQFQTDLVEFWQKLPNKAFFFALLAAWLALFHFLGNSIFGYVDTPSLFRWLLSVYLAKEPDGTYADDHMGILVPFIVIGVFWWKRKELMEIPLRTWWPGLLLVVAGLVIHIAGYVTQQPRASAAGMFLGIYGLMGLAWGPVWLRRSFFPFFLFGFCIPFAALIAGPTVRLRIFSAWIVEGIVHGLLGIDVVRAGTMLINPVHGYQYEVAGACSGIRSLLTIGLMATVGAFIYFKSWWRRAVLIASAVPLAVVGNALRLLSIVFAAEFGGGQEAGNAVHEGGPLGIISLLPYVPAFFGLMALGKWMDENKQARPGAAAESAESAVAGNAQRHAVPGGDERPREMDSQRQEPA